NLTLIVHGSTMGVNTLIQRNGARVGLLTTSGFEDVLEIGTMSRPEMYSAFYHKPRPLARREHRLGVHERVSARGEVISVASELEVCELVDQLLQDGVTSIAISTLNAYTNSDNEDAIARAVRRRAPDIALSVSHAIVNQRREF